MLFELGRSMYFEGRGREKGRSRCAAFRISLIFLRNKKGGPKTAFP